MTVAVSAAASLFTVHSFGCTASGSSREAADPTPSVADAADGIEPVASEAAGRGALAARCPTPPGPPDVGGANPNLSSLALELSRRAAGMSLDVPCTLTVPPPVVH